MPQTNDLKQGMLPNGKWLAFYLCRALGDDAKVTLKDESLTKLIQTLIREHCPQKRPPQKQSSLGTGLRPDPPNLLGSKASVPDALAIPPVPSQITIQNTDRRCIPDKRVDTAPICQHCQSGNLNIVSGKYGYYLSVLIARRIHPSRCVVPPVGSGPIFGSSN